MPLETREQTLNSLAPRPLDLLIIGGGIVGAGVARDAAMRGLRVGLVDRRDFAFGTSSRSSRLLHGGLRYLAQGRIGLVREASREKKILHHIAPHIAQPLGFVFPSYRGVPEWAHWKLRVGVKIYDLLCGSGNLGRSTSLNREETLQHIAGLVPDRLVGSVRYFDALTNDARLVLDTLQSAKRAGALLLNYTAFNHASRDRDLWQCTLSDELTDSTHTVASRRIINAAGPWADRLPHSAVKLRLTKGIHLVVERERLPVPDAVVMTQGKRILFAIPWGDRVILGTTDTDYCGSLDDIRADAADVDYVLGVANEFFPRAGLRTGDVISTWAGVRPLIAQPGGKPSDISRAHQILNPEPGWWDIAGGKLTTFRLMAEQAVDRVVESLRRSGALNCETDSCRTATEPLLPASEIDGISGIIPPELSRELIEHFCANEWATSMEDVIVRRTGWLHYHRDVMDWRREIAEWMAAIHGWTTERRESELTACEALVRASRPDGLS